MLQTAKITSAPAITGISSGFSSHSTALPNSTVLIPGLTTSASTVSWQTAFWTLVAIALNTCLQECGQVCGIKREFSILLRSSPIFCLTDTVVICVQLLYFAPRAGVRQAIEIIAASRNQRNFERAYQEPRLVNYITRGILLSAALTQSIKLFILRGVPWTQFFGASYLSSYCLNAILNVFGNPTVFENNLGAPEPYPREQLFFRKRVINPAAKLAPVLQIIAWMVALRSVLPEDGLFSSGLCGILLHLPGMLLYLTPLMIIWAFALATVSCLDFIIMFGPGAILFSLFFVHPRPGWQSVLDLISSLLDVSEDTAIIGTGTFLAIASLLLHLCLYPFMICSAVAERLAPLTVLVLNLFDQFDPYGVTLSFILIAAGTSYLLSRIILFGSLARRLRLTSLGMTNDLGCACLFLFMANVTFALLYFTLGYDPDGTYKPHWTENLGRLLR